MRLRGTLQGARPAVEARPNSSLQSRRQRPNRQQTFRAEIRCAALAERAAQIISRIRSPMIVRAIFSASGVPRASEVELG